MTWDPVRKLLALVEGETQASPTPRSPLAPCACGAPGVRNLGADGYCGTHLANLYATFDPAVFTNGGIGLPAGAQRPEFGPGIEDLTCCRCGAGWAGVVGDPCEWCRTAAAIMLDHQASLVLTPPDVDPADRTRPARLEGWLQRLKTATDAGIITEHQARAAWRAENRIPA